MITKETLAAQLNGRQYGDEITDAEAKQAKAAGLVVVFGASDDLTEFRGAINDEFGAYNGATHLVTKAGVMTPHSDCECPYCGFKDATTKAAKIMAQWCAPDSGYSWEMVTAIPHAAFDIMEEGEKFCRGIVFNLSDLP